MEGRTILEYSVFVVLFYLKKVEVLLKIPQV